MQELFLIVLFSSCLVMLIEIYGLRFFAGGVSQSALIRGIWGRGSFSLVRLCKYTEFERRARLV